MWQQNPNANVMLLSSSNHHHHHHHHGCYHGCYHGCSPHTAMAAAGVPRVLLLLLFVCLQGVSLAVCPPSCVQLVGSWADGSAVALPGGCVDVAVQIPSSCIPHKDHLNFRYW